MKRLPVQTKFAYGLGQIGEQVKTTGFTLFVLFYFQQVLGLSGTLAGTALLVALAFDAVTDPLAGSLSDNWKSPRGRRHPFMYASALPLGLTWFGLFFPPEGLGQLGLFLWLTVFAILVRASMTLYHVPHMALGAELTSDYDERTSVVAYRTTFGLIGAALLNLVAVRVFFPETPGFENGMLNPAGYPHVAFFGAILMVVTIWYSAWGTRDRIPHLPVAPDQPESLSMRRVFGEFATAWKNPSFRSLFIGFSMFAISLGVTGILGSHMNVFFWAFPTDLIAILVLPMVIGFLLGVAISGFLHRRFDKKPTIIGATLLAMTVGNLGIVLRLLGWFPENGDPLLIYLVFGLLTVVGVGSGIGYTSAGSMMADVAQNQAQRVGKEQQGILFSATSFSGKLATGMGQFIAGVGLDIIDFSPDVAPSSVDPSTLAQLGLLNLAAASVAFVGIYAYTHYDITREVHEEVNGNAQTTES